MRLATVDNGSPDGALVVVSNDLTECTPANEIAQTLQQAMDNWKQAEPSLQALSDALAAGTVAAVPFDSGSALAPLPRAWQWLDGSAYESHGNLMQAVFGMESSPKEMPLMYQGISDTLLAPTADVPLPSEEGGIDFEGEFGVIVDSVPMGISAEQALNHIRLVVQINDWSLRTYVPLEMKTGFGFVQAKPASSMAAVAVTTDELGDAWRDCRVALPLRVWWNSELFGEPDGYQMSFGFHELVAHAARTRNLVAGTIIGSGTVSNSNYREVGSTCIAERRGMEVLDQGEPKTPFMAFGDRVKMEAVSPDGSPLFGAIDQKVVRG